MEPGSPETPALVKLRRALISVSDKTGLAELGRCLLAYHIEIVSTGGTAAALAAGAVPVHDVSEVTGFPELMGGRLKTLHPRIHGGLLARREEPRDVAEAEAHGIEPIDLLVVNLYPFEQAIASGASIAASIESIDIGGPAMIRAAAKNHASVTVIVDPEDFPALEAELGAHDGATTAVFRARMAAKAFARTAAYDTAIATWFTSKADADTPAWRTVGGRLKQSLRYGENPHQKAAFYVTGDPRPGVATAVLRQGKALSFNNLNDADAAFELVAEFPQQAEAAVAIVKHANPCGVALGRSLVEAYRKALASDPVSAFGGIVALNRPLDEETAREIVRLFTEVLIAPGVSEAAEACFAAKKNLRLLTTAELPDPQAEGVLVRSVAGGLLFQSRDTARFATMARTVVTKRSPTAAEWRDLAFAVTVVKHVKSNAIVLAKDGATVGIGAGQMSRVDAVRMAVAKANEIGRAAGEAEPRSRGAVAASDAFFPFADALEGLAEAGVTAVIQPGGAARDGDVIAAADARQLAMVITGVRHFRH